MFVYVVYRRNVTFCQVYNVYIIPQRYRNHFRKHLIPLSCPQQPMIAILIYTSLSLNYSDILQYSYLANNFILNLFILSATSANEKYNNQQNFNISLTLSTKTQLPYSFTLFPLNPNPYSTPIKSTPASAAPKRS